MGGYIIKFIYGITLPNGKAIKPLFKCKAIIIPPLVGMLIFGCVARNCFGDFFMDYYPLIWAEWSRIICLSIILLRGGLNLKFKGIGKIVALLTVCPCTTEAIVVGIVSRFLLHLPWTLCFANGFCLGAVTPAVLVPSVFSLIKL